MSLHEKPAETPERKAFYDKIDAKSLTPLWTVLSNLITPEPKSGCLPHKWSFKEARSYLLEAGQFGREFGLNAEPHQAGVQDFVRPPLGDDPGGRV